VPHLANDSGALRLGLDLVQREGVRVQPGEQPPAARLLATATIEYLDARDREWWPFVRLPPLWLDAPVVEALVSGLRDLLQGTAPGFAWQSGPGGALGVQVGAGEGGAAVVEVGLDLGPFLADASGLPARSGGELALFRFVSGAADVVRFAGALEVQLAELLAS
jgi:hypothetical protein